MKFKEGRKLKERKKEVEGRKFKEGRKEVERRKEVEGRRLCPTYYSRGMPRRSSTHAHTIFHRKHASVLPGVLLKKIATLLHVLLFFCNRSKTSAVPTRSSVRTASTIFWKCFNQTRTSCKSILPAFASKPGMHGTSQRQDALSWTTNQNAKKRPTESTKRNRTASPGKTNSTCGLP